MVGYSEHDNERSGSTKGANFVDELSDYQFLMKDHTPCSLLEETVENMLLPYTASELGSMFWVC